MLHSIDKAAVGEKFNLPADTIIEVGPVKIPQYLDRPQIVTQDKNKMLVFAQLDRWGEPLDAALERLITEDLAAMLPAASLQMFPYNFTIPLKYQVLIDIIQLDCALDGDLFLAAQWTIIDVPNKKMLLTKRSDFRQPVSPREYAGLAAALETVCAALSSQIAQTLSTFGVRETSR